MFYFSSGGHNIFVLVPQMLWNSTSVYETSSQTQVNTFKCNGTYFNINFKNRENNLFKMKSLLEPQWYWKNPCI